MSLTEDLTTPIKEEKEPPKDEEGLLLSYDAIICGTGLVQSILAAALTRAGKTVLHCDGNDHYGELDTVWTFEYLQELIKTSQEKSKKNNTADNTDKNNDHNHGIPLAKKGSYQNLKFHSSGVHTDFPVTEAGRSVQTPYGLGKILHKRLPSDEDKYGHVAVSLENWTMADGKHPIVYVGISKDNIDGLENEAQPSDDAIEKCVRKQHPDVISTRTLAAKRILQQQSRSLALDVTPQLLYASGSAVQAFLTSGVAEHMEFQTMHAVYWLQTTNDDGTATLERVPCSKGDVVQSPLLPPLDKRRFMKFFQLAMDYATERELQHQQEQEQQQADDEETTNEDTEESVLSLNERQLNQGRSLARPQNKAISQKDLTILHECMDQNMEFDAYLEEHAKFSPQLRQLIRHALALEIGSANSDTTANLNTKEGMGRLCDHLKALGRFGTTAFLTPLFGSGEMSQFFCRSAAVYGATYLLRRAAAQVNLINDNGSKRVESVTICSGDNEVVAGMNPIPMEKKIKGSHVVLAKEAKIDAPCRRRLVRRISVVRGSAIPATIRSVIIIPPNGIGNHKCAIHGLVLDESARVAPHGCNLVHLTTVVDQNGATADSDDIGCLQKALRLILDTSVSSSEPAADEIFHTTFSYGICDDLVASNIQGLYEIGRHPMPLAVDEAFDQAQSIFKKICGSDEEFLSLSAEMEAKLKEQLQDAYRGPNHVDDDTEQYTLDSAMDMISS